MNSVHSDRGGWFGGQQDSTGSSALDNVPKYILAASFGFFVITGTVAASDDLNQLRKLQTNKPGISSPTKLYAVQTISERTPANDLERIRTILSPAMSDLAKSFNVSRQTIYNWLNGENPTSEHTARLKDLALAADTFSDAGITVSGILLKRKIIDGKNLFEFVQSGGAAADAAQLLSQMVKRESEQKERLASRFAGRSVTQSAADSDLMAANDVE